MDECGDILLLLRAWRCVWRAGKNCRDIVVQIDGREIDGMARNRAGIEASEPALGIYDSVPSDTVACRFGVSCVGHLIHAHSARGGLVHREGIPDELPAPVGARHRIAGAFDLRNAASSSGVIALVECVWKNGSYRRHVSIGSLSSAPPGKKSNSLGLRTT